MLLILSQTGNASLFLDMIKITSCKRLIDNRNYYTIINLFERAAMIEF